MNSALPWSQLRPINSRDNAVVPDMQSRTRRIPHEQISAITLNGPLQPEVKR